MQTSLEKALEKDFPELQPRFYVHERRKFVLPTIESWKRETGMQDSGLLALLRWAYASASPRINRDDIDEAEGSLYCLYRRLTFPVNGYFLEYGVESTALHEGREIGTSREDILEIMRKNEYEEKIRLCYNESFMFHLGTVSEDQRKQETTVVGCVIDPKGRVSEMWTLEDVEGIDKLTWPERTKMEIDIGIVYKGQEQNIRALKQLQGKVVDPAMLASEFATLLKIIGSKNLQSPQTI
ncbi:MAG TPA: hypothetical protein VJJ75_01285 [Candidatus Nanoarchaeia archaeon]|nr:hypothetical protein [Candidatus Nanoarchaeia archaeon]